jgi:hypothetical protein
LIYNSNTKTFTMEGYGKDIGVAPRAIAELLNQVF